MDHCLSIWPSGAVGGGLWSPGAVCVCGEGGPDHVRVCKLGNGGWARTQSPMTPVTHSVLPGTEEMLSPWIHTRAQGSTGLVSLQLLGGREGGLAWRDRAVLGAKQTPIHLIKTFLRLCTTSWILLLYNHTAIAKINHCKLGGSAKLGVRAWHRFPWLQPRMERQGQCPQWPPA